MNSGERIIKENVIIAVMQQLKELQLEAKTKFQVSTDLDQ